MAEKKKKLNKGLDAIFGGDITSLIDDIEHNTPESSQEKIKLDEIRPNPYQPRKVFDEQALNELALSIQEHGIFQPVILKKSVQGYEIVAGERRCRAARMAHLEEVPAIIVDFSDQQMMEIALLENIQREDLNAIEEAQAYQTMMEKLKLTQNELAILHEKDKEFVQEGQRWWDVLRMTLTKGGKHLVFCKEANLKNNGQPILNEATEAYKVLWPIEQKMLDKDPEIKQTPGYK